MPTLLAHHWWALVLRGVIAIVFGVLAWMWPGAAIASFVLLYGAYALVDGIFSLVAAIRPAPGQSRGWLVVTGILGILAGLVVLFMPGLSTVILFYVVAIWAIAIGISQILTAIAIRKVVTGEWTLALAGVLTLLLGIFMLFNPAAGLLGLVWAIAIWAVVFGVLLIALGFRLRSWREEGAELDDRGMAGV